MARAFTAGSPYSGSSRMALACFVSTLVTAFLKLARSSGVAGVPRAFAMAFSSDPRWSMAAAAMTPASFAHALMPATFPFPNFTAMDFSCQPKAKHGHRRRSIRAAAPCSTARPPLLWPHMPDLEQDTTLRLPRVTVLKASAGSGKTFRLTQRYVQFLLSEKIPHNQLRNLMAITFSNNASREMRKNVLEWLKRLCLKDPERIRRDGGGHRGRRGAPLAQGRRSSSRTSCPGTPSSRSGPSTASCPRCSAPPRWTSGSAPISRSCWTPSPSSTTRGTCSSARRTREARNARLLDRTIESVLDFKTSGGSFAWDPSTPLLAEIRKVEEKLCRHGRDARRRGSRDRACGGSSSRSSRAMEIVDSLVRTLGPGAARQLPFERHLAEVRAGRFSDLLAGP